MGTFIAFIKTVHMSQYRLSIHGKQPANSSCQNEMLKNYFLCVAWSKCIDLVYEFRNI